MKDSFRSLYPKAKAFSRYYSDTRGQGATRIDRQYHFGEITIKEARSDLEQTINLLRTTRFSNDAEILSTMLNQMFQ